MSPTQRALKDLRAMGCTAQVVEHWNAFARRRIDLFGVVDIVCLCDGIVGIQVTSGSSHAARRSKILAEPRAKEWIQNGGHLQIWSYSKRGARGKRKTWERRVETIEIEDFA